jgi:hypothetical protein
MTKQDTTIVEWAPFRIGAEISEDQLRAASADLETEFLSRQAGYLRRELLRTDDGGYVDLVWWESAAAAQTAMEAVAGSAACARYFALMAADAAAGVRHFARIAAYAR